MDNIDFVSIDFETMTPELTSACSVGLVKVINSKITQKFYSLIKPIPDGRCERNTFVHGLTDEMVMDAPTFKDIFPILREFIGDLPLVCHNRATDMNIITRCMDYYNLTGLQTSNNVDTLELFGKNLKACCEDNGIILDNHHDALADAEACAKLYLCYQGCICHDLAHYNLKEILSNDKRDRKYQHDTLIPLSEEDIDRLFNTVKSTLEEMTRRGGRDTEKDLYGALGNYRTILSKNTYHDPCPVCGERIQKEAYLGGSIYYCPHCQRER